MELQRRRKVLLLLKNRAQLKQRIAVEERSPGWR
jgi:hypothetical protein